jgi:hypothetical protein
VTEEKKISKEHRLRREVRLDVEWKQEPLKAAKEDSQQGQGGARRPGEA